ncbi:MAG: MliC family protein [Gemmatimonadales bacterium]
MTSNARFARLRAQSASRCWSLRSRAGALARGRWPSGARYSDGTWTFWTKERAALLQRGDTTLYHECMASSS